MNKLVFATFATLLAFGLTPSAAAESYTATYVGASPGGVGLTSTAPSLVVPGSQFGGARFTQDGSAPLSVTVTDATNNNVFVVVCQDIDADSRCGEAADGITQIEAEPRMTGCGGADLTIAAVAFQPDFDTLVFVYSTNAPGTTCIGTATTGTITLVTALSDQDG